MQTLLTGTRGYQLLKKEKEGEGLSHAYLLVWEDESSLREGIKTFAKLFFDCENPATAQQTRVAELIDTESFCDCVFFPEKGKKLVVEDAENILEESNLAPVEGDKKLFVLTDFAEANAQTQNKLLKLLEEPPKGVYFLLGASSAFPVLQTVLSRVKKIEILPFTEEEIACFLTRKYGNLYEKSALLACAATAAGSVGEACKLLNGGYYASLLDGAFSLLSSPLHLLPTTIKQVGETSHKRGFLYLLRLLCRDALLLKMGKRKKITLSTEGERLERLACGFSKGALLYAQEAISEAEKQVKFNAIFSQCVETCVAKILAKNKENI